jgi:hypothetical protein
MGGLASNSAISSQALAGPGGAWQYFGYFLHRNFCNLIWIAFISSVAADARVYAATKLGVSENHGCEG